MTGKRPFEMVVAEHGATVLRVCRAVLGPADAEDAWSETFLAALKAYPQLPADANVEAWLVTIAPRKAIDVTRAAGRRAGPVAEGPARPSAARADGRGLTASPGCARPTRVPRPEKRVPRPERKEEESAGEYQLRAAGTGSAGGGAGGYRGAAAGAAGAAGRPRRGRGGAGCGLPDAGHPRRLAAARGDAAGAGPGRLPPPGP